MALKFISRSCSNIQLQFKTFFSLVFQLHMAIQIKLDSQYVGIGRLQISFCYQNFSDLLWEKIVLVIEKIFWKSRLKAENFLGH